MACDAATSRRDQRGSLDFPDIARRTKRVSMSHTGSPRLAESQLRNPHVAEEQYFQPCLLRPTSLDLKTAVDNDALEGFAWSESAWCSSTTKRAVMRGGRGGQGQTASASSSFCGTTTRHWPTSECGALAPFLVAFPSIRKPDTRPPSESTGIYPAN